MRMSRNLGVYHSGGLPEFADASWEQICSACNAHTVPENWKIGDTHDISLNGIVYKCQIIGKDHDEIQGGGIAALTLQLGKGYDGVDTATNGVFNTAYRIDDNSRTNGWEQTEMRETTLRRTILSYFPDVISENIKTVSKVTGRMGGDDKRITGDTLFLLSEVEVFGTTQYSVSGEGSQYEYYANGNSKVRYANGSPVTWWLRSPRRNNTNNNLSVIGNGNVYNQYAVTTTQYVSFAFCL